DRRCRSEDVGWARLGLEGARFLGVDHRVGRRFGPPRDVCGGSGPRGADRREARGGEDEQKAVGDSAHGGFGTSTTSPLGSLTSPAISPRLTAALPCVLARLRGPAARANLNDDKILLRATGRVAVPLASNDGDGAPNASRPRVINRHERR